MTPQDVASGVRAELGAAVRCEVDGATVSVELAPAQWLDGLRFARDRAGCDYFDWLSAVDEGDAGFAVVVHLYSIADKCHLLMRAMVPRESPVLTSAASVFRGAAWHERETNEMFGVIFEGHPGPGPLLLPDGFVGHPLRKDFELAARSEKEWPGWVEPGERRPTERSRRRLSPPGGAGGGT